MEEISENTVIPRNNSDISEYPSGLMTLGIKKYKDFCATASSLTSIWLCYLDKYSEQKVVLADWSAKRLESNGEIKDLGKTKGWNLLILFMGELYNSKGLNSFATSQRLIEKLIFQTKDRATLAMAKNNSPLDIAGTDVMNIWSHFPDIVEIILLRDCTCGKTCQSRHHTLEFISAMRFKHAKIIRLKGAKIETICECGRKVKGQPKSFGVRSTTLFLTFESFNKNKSTDALVLDSPVLAVFQEVITTVDIDKKTEAKFRLAYISVFIAKNNNTDSMPHQITITLYRNRIIIYDNIFGFGDLIQDRLTTTIKKIIQNHFERLRSFDPRYDYSLAYITNLTYSRFN